METPTSAQIDAQAVVERLFARHGWNLIERSEFVEQLMAHRQDTPPLDREGLTKLAVNRYCEVLYAACNSNSERRQQAYTELAHYLYDHALHKYREPELAHEITHDAIILIHEQRSNCHNPGAFLAFALLKLWNAATTHFRRRDRHDRRATTLVVDDGEEGGREPVDQQSPAPEAVVVRSEVESSVTARLAALIEESPRAAKQIQAVVLKYLCSYSDEEIAAQLATDIANVHVLRSRGLKRLRGDPILSAIAAALE